MKALEVIKPKIREKPDRSKWDWLMLDLSDAAWEWAANYYIENVFGENAADYFLAIRKDIQKSVDTKKPTADEFSREILDGWVDYRVINKVFQKWINTIYFQIPAHIYATAQTEKLQRVERDAYIVETFQKYGWRPTGEKRMSRRSHTIVMLHRGSNHEYLASMPKSRSRKRWDKLKVVDFGMQYLVGHAKWELA